MPESVASRVLKNIFFSENFPIGNRLDLTLQRNRVVYGAERVRERMELATFELRRYVVCKTRTEECQAAVVIDFEISGGKVYFREEIHAANLNRKKATRVENAKWRF